MEITKELVERARACQTAEELIALAKENDIELSYEDAELYLQDFKEGEVSDEELDDVSGGQEGCAQPPNPYEDVYWQRKEDVQYIFNIGDHVEAFADFCRHHTATCWVRERKAEEIFKPCTSEPVSMGWADVYLLEKLPGVRAPFSKEWYQRSHIEK